MGRLAYLAIASLDGFVADRNGQFGWGEPDEEVHTFVNDLARSFGRYLYGRRMYEVMVAWEHAPLANQPAFIRDFAELWRAADKVVYSRTLAAVSTGRTRIERRFDPEVVSRMKATSATGITVGGPGLARHAFEAGLVDDCLLFVAPIVVGGGTQLFPDGVRVNLELMDERRFGNGMVHLRYRTLPEAVPEPRARRRLVSSRRSA
jgi:dihydrofolate reductase